MNNEVKARHIHIPGNGLACPKCGFELYDSSPNLTLDSFPPRKNVACFTVDCGYQGYEYRNPTKYGREWRHEVVSAERAAKTSRGAARRRDV